LVWVAVALPVLLAFVSLAVDLGRVQVAKTELRGAADTAARYAVTGLSNGIATVRARAKDAADDNTTDGTPVVLADADIEQGNWSTSTKTFTANGTPLNAVRVTARRTGASAVPLMFARVLGQGSMGVQASAIATAAGGQAYGFIGLNGVTFFNNTYIGSYNSASDTTPTQGESTGNASVGTNGTLESKNNTTLDGELALGPSGATVGSINPDEETNLSTAIPTPTDPAWNPTTNPLSLPQNYSVGSATTLPGGTYWFTSLTLNNNGALDFSGPATIYVNGNITVEKNWIRAHQLSPSNLKIYQLGNNRTFTCNNNFELVGQISAPRTALVANNMFTLHGIALFRTIELKNNASIYVDDVSMAGAASGGSVSLVR
jgi:Flp pilus assembly protein TadG